MKKIAVLSGAGISAESGITTFRDSGGLWDQYDYNLVATSQGWKKDKSYVLDFYNKARQLIKDCKPNQGHIDLVKLEDKFHVDIITQNIDDLHERAGSTNVTHLHGEIFKSRSSLDPTLKYSCYENINLGDKCGKGSQLRPDVVWFGEAVPEMEKALTIVKEADIVIVIGTSLQVYPAASLVNTVDRNIPMYLVDPGESAALNVKHIKEKASVGVNIVVNLILNES